MSKAPAKTVDEYLALAPKKARAKLAQLREIIKSAAPQADEVISYGMPYYKYHGSLAGFAAFKDHVGFFMAIEAEQKRELKAYEFGKGSVRFPIDKPLPVALVKKLVKARARKNEGAQKGKK